MEKATIKERNIYLLIGAILVWFAVVFQFFLIIINRVASLGETIVRFFSFFTILTNILVALCVSFLLLKPKSTPGIFFSKTTSLTAVTVYITIVGIVYNIVLRFLWEPKGLQMVVDELLHTVIPVYFIIFWMKFVPKTRLKWKNVFPWCWWGLQN